MNIFYNRVAAGHALARDRLPRTSRARFFPEARLLPKRFAGETDSSAQSSARPARAPFFSRTRARWLRIGTYSRFVHPNQRISLKNLV